MNLFAESENLAIAQHAPLAVRMRPVTIDEILGQQEFLGPGRLLRRMLEANRLSSLVFYGPPGTGKTTLAHVIATQIECEFHALNAARATVKEVRAVIDSARALLGGNGKRTVLFIDELHRFNRAQQDVLLGDVEHGVIVLIGATTENPFFTINSPLLSRSTVFEFHPLTEDDIVALMRRAIADTDRGLGKYTIDAHDDALHHLAQTANGDARRALTALEVGVLSQLREAGRDDLDVVFDLAIAQESIQTKALQYDRDGDGHYDTISAFIKSMRGSDPDAAVYWLARMIVAGEDPRFIARRIAITASEDVGNADPRAIQIAQAAWTLTERIGLPECQVTLAQAAIYMACAPKSNACSTAINTAIDDVKNQRTVPIPKSLQDAHYAGAKKLGRGEGYQYAHSFEGGVSPDQDYLGVDVTYYTPTDRGYEKHIGAYLEWVAKLRSS